MTTKTIILTAGLFLTSLTSFAQTDAKNYFDGKPWGFATVSDELGTAYSLNGGMQKAQPSTIVLYAQGDGATDDNNIYGAINQYDIIVLDGSNGDFTIGQNIKLSNIKDKTIVGRNGARLCTQFYLTDDDITYLNQQNLSGLSSTEQYTGTLPDGTTLTCDKRAFFTKKAMEELAYQKGQGYVLPNKAGIFSITDCEDLIIRNISFIGPGAVDIDGSDLITNQDSKQIWVDHCTFVDGQDGCLDSKRCDYCTYTWNKFYYTSRTFSHPYTNGCGWVDESDPMMLHLTWACNEWGSGCGRRLPQCGSCYVHIINNYHNCPGNSAGITLNDNVIGLVEYNYSASGVSLPLTGSGSDRYIYAHDNNYVYASTSTSVTVPYSYTSITESSKNLPDILEATHGAGATIDDMFMPGDATTLADGFGFYSASVDVTVGFTSTLPLKNLVGAQVSFASSDASIVTVDASGKVKALKEGSAEITATVNDALYGTATATITVNATANNNFNTVKKWNFTSRSTAVSSLTSNGWTASGSNYTYSSKISDAELPGLAEAEGLYFSCSNASAIVSYSNSLRINKAFTMTIPDCQAGDKIILDFKSANGEATRGFETTTNITTSGALTTCARAQLEAIVTADGSASFTSSSGGFYIYTIELQRLASGDTGIKSAKNISTVPVIFYNILGQKVSATAKGLKIGSDGKKYIE